MTLSNLILVECMFENNEGRVAISAMYSNITIAQNIFRENIDLRHLLLLINSNVVIFNSKFINNEGILIHNEVMSVAKGMKFNVLTITGSEFRNNYSGSLRYTIIDVENSDISIVKTESFNNTADSFMVVSKSFVSVDKSTFKHNNGVAIRLVTCKVDIYNSVYDSNR